MMFTTVLRETLCDRRVTSTCCRSLLTWSSLSFPSCGTMWQRRCALAARIVDCLRCANTSVSHLSANSATLATRPGLYSGALFHAISSSRRCARRLSGVRLSCPVRSSSLLCARFRLALQCPRGISLSTSADSFLSKTPIRFDSDDGPCFPLPVESPTLSANRTRYAFLVQAGLCAALAIKSSLRMVPRRNRFSGYGRLRLRLFAWCVNLHYRNHSCRSKMAQCIRPLRIESFSDLIVGLPWL